jgi:DNA-binding NtrC family response regulator
VRELENIVERAVVLTRGQTIGVEDLPPQVQGAASDQRSAVSHPLAPGSAGGSINPTRYTGQPLEKALQEPEKQIILGALEAHDWNRQKTADALGINRTTLYKKIKQYDLEQYGRTG